AFSGFYLKTRKAASSRRVEAQNPFDQVAELAGIVGRRSGVRFVALFELEHGFAGDVQKQDIFRVRLAGIFFRHFAVGRRLLALLNGVALEAVAFFGQSHGRIFIDGLRLDRQRSKK
ncbi:MAG TPA: hypothetical protein VFH22_07235, partial [Rhodocyclaceae bacterium]|nr:hypothetical protein [Rhodocyclaceae bacterium]